MVTLGNLSVILNILNTENMIRFFVAGDIYGAGRIREKVKCFLKMNLRKMKVLVGMISQEWIQHCWVKQSPNWRYWMSDIAN